MSSTRFPVTDIFVALKTILKMEIKKQKLFNDVIAPKSYGCCLYGYVTDIDFIPAASVTAA